MQAQEIISDGPCLEVVAVTWIEGATGKKQGDLTTAEWLRDGVILCELINGFQPGTIRNISKMRAPILKKQNILNFIRAAENLGLHRSETFAPPDLYEENDMGAVISCICALRRVVEKTLPFALCGEVRHAGSVQNAGTATAAGLAAADRNARPSNARVVAAASLDSEHDRQVAEWIEAATGEQRELLSTAEWLKSGEVLCMLANSVKLGSVENLCRFKTPAAKMENIQKFLSVARSSGMPQSSLFSVADLYEEKNMGAVIRALYTFICFVVFLRSQGKVKR